MKKNRKNFVLFTAGLVFLIAALVAFNMYNKGPVDVAEAKAITSDPVSLYSAYLSDSVSAQQKFDGQIIQLTGEIAGLSENMQKQQVILIKTTPGGGNINCTMDQTAADLAVGNMVTLKGICSGMGQGDADLGIAGDVYLTRTIIAN